MTEDSSTLNTPADSVPTIIDKPSEEIVVDISSNRAHKKRFGLSSGYKVSRSKSTDDSYDDTMAHSCLQSATSELSATSPVEPTLDFHNSSSKQLVDAILDIVDIDITTEELETSQIEAGSSLTADSSPIIEASATKDLDVVTLVGIDLKDSSDEVEDTSTKTIISKTPKISTRALSTDLATKSSVELAAAAGEAARKTASSLISATSG